MILSSGGFSLQLIFVGAKFLILCCIWLVTRCLLSFWLVDVLLQLPFLRRNPGTLPNRHGATSDIDLRYAMTPFEILRGKCMIGKTCDEKWHSVHTRGSTLQDLWDVRWALCPTGIQRSAHLFSPRFVLTTWPLCNYRFYYCMAITHSTNSKTASVWWGSWVLWRFFEIPKTWIAKVRCSKLGCYWSEQSFVQGCRTYKIFRNSQDHNSKKRWRIYKTW